MFVGGVVVASFQGGRRTIVISSPPRMESLVKTKERKGRHHVPCTTFRSAGYTVEALETAVTWWPQA